MQGNLLDDSELVEVLAATKATGEEITDKLTVASETRAKITEACEEYRVVAKRATYLYNLIAVFSCVNPMYQASCDRTHHSRFAYASAASTSER